MIASDWDKELETEEGFPVTVMARNVRDSHNRPILIKIKDNKGYDRFELCYTDGSYWEGMKMDINAKAKVIKVKQPKIYPGGWMTFHLNTKGETFSSIVYETKELANLAAGQTMHKRVGCIQIPPFTEGEGTK